jgi:hypothetical protein
MTLLVGVPANATVGHGPAASKPTAADIAADNKLADKNQAIVSQFIAEHPEDYAGLEDLSMRLTGKHIEVAFAGVQGMFTGHEAQAMVDGAKAAKASTDVSVSPMSVIPSDAFTVSISSVAISTWNRSVTGSWNFKDGFVNGDGNPDFASLGFTYPSCVTMSNLTSSTYKWNNAPTSSSNLRSSNLGNKAPIWNVFDNISNFERSNDHGSVSARLTNNCGTVQYNIQAAFNYEANIGASALSVGASIGLISASYNGGADVYERGTNPITFAL